MTGLIAATAALVDAARDPRDTPYVLEVDIIGGFDVNWFRCAAAGCGYDRTAGQRWCHTHQAALAHDTHRQDGPFADTRHAGRRQMVDPSPISSGSGGRPGCTFCALQTLHRPPHAAADSVDLVDSTQERQEATTR